ncbi:MAG: hypothetical protein QM692_07110 [Thermomicrobiales bacterium]
MSELLFEFTLSAALLGIPIALAWLGKERQKVWYSIGALIVLIAFARLFFL